MKAFVDRDICIGCEACAGTCPEVFSMDSEGISVPIEWVSSFMHKYRIIRIL